MNFTNDLRKMKDYPPEFEETFNEMLSENQIDAIKHKAIVKSLDKYTFNDV